jgi:hypothetical protein
MESANGLGELVDHLTVTTRLNREEAGRAVAEVLAYFSESLEQFVTRRHAELQEEQHKNAAIFEEISAELTVRRFVAPSLTARQVRRIIYG